MSNRVISTVGALTGYSAAVSIDAANDYFLLQQSGSYKKVNRNILLGVTGTPMDTSTVQNVTNKTLDATNAVTLKDTLFTLQDDADTTKQARFQLSGITTGTTRTYTLPNASSTLMDLATAQTATNKTLTSPIITGGSMDNTTITVDAIGEHTAASGVTIDGLNIKDGKLNQSNSVVTASITDGAVTPAKLVAGAGSGWAWQTFSPTWSNFTVGNGTVAAHYSQTGKKIKIFITATLGTTSAVGGDISFVPPVAASSVYTLGGFNSIVGMGTMLAGSTGALALPFFNASNASIHIGYLSPSATSNSLIATGTNAPGTWTSTNQFQVQLEYEAA